MTPKLSIITINRNNAVGLRKTIKSVFSQSCTNFEYIIIDGGSSDESDQLIKEYVDIIDYWVSEPDSGIYNAMNKGISKATGEFCLFLNSGDWLVDEKVVADFYNSNFKEDIISGSIFILDSDSKKTTLVEPPNSHDLSFELFYTYTLPHQASFIKRNLFETYGFYNESIKIVSDWEFFFKVLVLNNCTYNRLDRIISYYDSNGFSSQPETLSIMMRERSEVFHNSLPLITKYITKLVTQNEVLQSHENEYREYINLKYGNLSIFIKLMLWVKKLKSRKIL